MANYLSNSFSIQMIGSLDYTLVQFEKIEPKDVPNNVVSAIGHADTATICSSMLGIPIPANRVSIQLTHEDTLYVVQVLGGRLPEGCTSLPPGIELQFYRVRNVGGDKSCRNCNTKHLVEIEITSAKMLAKFNGRYYKDDLNGKLKLIDSDRDTHLINKTIYLRSPITCACRPNCTGLY